MTVENIGMCPPMNDRDFFNLLTDSGTKDVDMILKFYPKLNIYIKEKVWKEIF
jgi:hypothetical protein